MALEGTVAFTGRLASMRRADAFALVRTHGGKPREGVTKRTDVLIVGEFGWPLLDDGRPSNSLARAKSYRVPIASERQFLQWRMRTWPGAGACNVFSVSSSRPRLIAWTARYVDAASIVHPPTGFIATPILSCRLRPRRRVSLTCGTLRAHLA